MIYRIAALFTILLALYVGYMGYAAYQAHAAKKAIFEGPTDQTFGPENADLTVVKFMDYACEHCREVHPALMKALEEDGHVKLIVRPLPSASSDGSQSARIVYTAATLGKFRETHDYLMEHFGPVDQSFVDNLAAAIDSTPEALEEAYANEETGNAVWENKRLFDALGGRVTPTFFIGPDTIFIPYEGMPTADNFKTMFNEARKGL
ncbi:MAG: thioredoxin domain-containing protein [Alphaproteobacteria bacterium]|nr:thioredoxin domain-containing protein [Alphaproteobacteria bacterium]MCD8520089.1 thioredoxin domain-containing protein [Alphaproteobacteria bacterium]MCD8525867.1 thioredoxin domain-containing protein [Alphaproteobacteria bacterium]MCD8570726.1 thioredoxin domain-containing protein [Alphaproteobacteria bacterium]